MIKLLHADTQAKVICDGRISESFRIRTSGKQDCVLAPTLFSVFMAYAIQDYRSVILGFDGEGLLNLVN